MMKKLCERNEIEKKNEIVKEKSEVMRCVKIIVQ